MYKTIAVVFAAALMFCSPALVRAADDAGDAQKEKDVRHLLEAMGTQKMAKQVFDAVMGQMKGLYPQVPQEFWTEVSKQADTDGFISLLVPVYMKHFTDEEVLELTKFYESPIGKKLVSEQPAMVQESMVAGRQWGMSLGQKIVKQLADKGYSKT